MLNELTTGRLLEEASELAVRAGPGGSSGFLLELAANLIRLIVLGQIDSFDSHLWLASADLRAPESVQKEYLFSLNQGSLSPVLADIERLRKEIAGLEHDAVTAADAMAASYIATAGEHEPRATVSTALGVRSIAAGASLARAGSRLLGISIHIVPMIPEARWPLLLFAGRCCAQAARDEAQTVRRRLGLLGVGLDLESTAGLNGITELCQERLAQLERISAGG